MKITLSIERQFENLRKRQLSVSEDLRRLYGLIISKCPELEDNDEFYILWGCFENVSDEFNYAEVLEFLKSYEGETK